ncbi:amino acid ABC transporter substrate-binding protein [Acaricomes phytoseiuli]|uniref:amino acid ABC transporter substrate-binding protein n=1 Tax=Acaricomes phytoseiuli TaxID=291968 RepID=UPI0003724282|nr:amino acid ABC transporter substrate-binding protein [Acaricomes phytoseiuli]MCW1249485.1 amino acid ABC transporter substrate-binding protein [Acaricomes phytoseiuli]
MKLRALAGIAVIAALALTGCSAGNSGEDTSLSDATSRGELIFGTEGTYKPFTYRADGGSGAITGYDVEIAQAVAEKLGVTATFQETQFDGIFAGLDSSRFDLIANQIAINPEREQKYLFSTPYTLSTGVIVTRMDDSSISSFNDLNGKTTAQSMTSNWYRMAQENGANVQGVEGWAQSVALLQQGRVDAIVNDKLTFLDFEQNTPDSGLKIAAESPDTSRSAFVARQGSTALIEAVNQALSELSADGTLTRISEKYFGADVSQ